MFLLDSPINKFLYAKIRWAGQNHQFLGMHCGIRITRVRQKIGLGILAIGCTLKEELPQYNL